MRVYFGPKGSTLRLSLRLAGAFFFQQLGTEGRVTSEGP